MAKKRAKQGRRPTKKAAKQAAKPVSKRAPEAEERRKPTRTERWEAERRERRRRDLRRRVAVGGAVAVLLGGVIAWQVNARRNARSTIESMTGGTCRYDTRSDPGRTGEHAPSVTFRLNPPSGGVHPTSVARAGVYTAANRPSDGNVVHALEHGYVAIWYRPDLAADDVEALGRLQGDFSDDVLVLPQPGLDTAVAATAWHRRLLCAELEPTSLRRFVEAYVGEGPEKVPRG